MKKLILKTASSNYFFFTYLATLLFSFHYYFITYINSSYISQFVGDKNIGVLYSIGAIINLIIFFNIQKILRKYGNYKTMLYFLGIELVCLAILATSKTTALLALTFIIHDAINPMMIVGLDIFLERFSKRSTTGTVRGVFLTVMSTAAVISPIIVGSIINKGNYKLIYMISGLFMVALFSLVYYYYRNYQDPAYKEETGLAVVNQILGNKDIKQIFIINVTLQIFYSWMIVFIPIYLHEYLNFGWPTIGMIISISLIPFVLFEIPLGELADKKIGEKEILIAGMIMIISVVTLMGLITSTSLLIWIALLTLGRAGASFVEVAGETYFFKHINEKNEELASFWRAANPIGFLLGTLTGTGALIILAYGHIFFALAGILLIGLFYSLKIKDTM